MDEEILSLILGNEARDLEINNLPTLRLNGNIPFR
jgi:hypothetical protein